MSAQIEALNVGQGIALTSDGATVTLSMWFDADGDCEPDEAAACAGQDDQGRWWSIDLREFEKAVIQ